MHQKGTKRFPDDPKHVKTKAKTNAPPKPKPEIKKKSNDFLEMRKEVEKLKELLQKTILNGSVPGTHSEVKNLPMQPMGNHMMYQMMNQGFHPMFTMSPPLMNMNNPMMPMNHPLMSMNPQMMPVNPMMFQQQPMNQNV